jgi:MFS family permease
VCPVLSRKYLLILGLTAFSLIVAFTSFSRSGVVIDVMCGLAGLASSAIIPIAVGMLSIVYPAPSRRKNIVFSSFLMGNPAATIIGGMGSGALATNFNWKAAFIFLGVMYALVTILCWAAVPNVSESQPDPKVQEQQLDIADPLVHISRRTPSVGDVLQRFDWIGLVLLVAGVLLLTVALTIGPEGSRPWKTPVVILLLTLGILLVGCFIMWERSTSTPMIPPAVWESNSICLVSPYFPTSLLSVDTILQINFSALTSAMAYYSSVFWVSMFLQNVQNYEPFDTSVRLLPQALMGLFFSPLVGLILHQVPGTILLVVAGLFSVLSNVLLIFLTPESNYFSLIFPSLLLATLGMDWTMNIGSVGASEYPSRFCGC